MEKKEKEIDLKEIAKAIGAQKRKLVKWGLLGLTAGVVIAFSLPKEYKSTIKIAPETKTQSSSMGQLGGFAAMMGVSMSGSTGGGIDKSLYPEVIKSGPFLAEFSEIKVPFDGRQITLEQYLTKEQKAPWWSYVFGAPRQFLGWVFSGDDKPQKEQEEDDDVKKPSDVRRAFENILSGRMKVEADKKSGLITLDVTMQGPGVSLVVADSLFEKLSRYMSDYYTAKARNDLNNSQAMFTQAQGEYHKAETQYAAAMDQNQNLIRKSAQIKVDRYKNERDLAYMVYQQLAQQVEGHKIALQQDTPIATVIEPARMPNIPVSPNKKMIIIALTFLGVFSAAAVVVVKRLNAE